MSGVNSHTHDPIAIGGQLDWGTKEVFKCQLCDTEMPEEALTPYDGYKACSECIEQEEQLKKEIDSIPTGTKIGYSQAVLDILELDELAGDDKANIRIAILEMASRKTA